MSDLATNPVETNPVAIDYGITDAMIEAKRASYALLKCDTPEGIEAVRVAKADCRTMRKKLDDRKKELNEDARKHIELVNSIHKKIYAAVESIEAPLDKEKEKLDAAIKAKKEAKEKAEREAEAKRLAEKNKAEEDRLKAIREADEKVRAAERAELEREKKELADARAKRKAEQEAEEKAAENNRLAMQEIQGIHYQLAIAQSGRSGVRVGGTIQCIEDTLAETERWAITEEHFGSLFNAAKLAKETTIAAITALLTAAKQKHAEDEKRKADQAAEDTKRAEDKRIADEAAKKERERLEEIDRQQKAAQAAIDAEKKRLDDERIAREKAEAERIAAEQAAQAENDRIERERIEAEAKKQADEERRARTEIDRINIRYFSEGISNVERPSMTTLEGIAAMNNFEKSLADLLSTLENF